MARISGGAGDQQVADRLVIDLDGTREGDKKSAKAAFLLAPAMGDRQTIHNQVFTFMFPGANTQRFVFRDMALYHQLPAGFPNNTLPGFARPLAVGG